MSRRDAASACRAASNVLAAPTKHNVSVVIATVPPGVQRRSTAAREGHVSELAGNPICFVLCLCLARRLYVRVVPAEGRRGHAYFAEVAAYPAWLLPPTWDV